MQPVNSLGAETGLHEGTIVTVLFLIGILDADGGELRWRRERGACKVCCHRRIA
jgi:hypothetical protein